MARPPARLFDREIERIDEVWDGDTIRVWYWKGRYDLTWTDIRTLYIQMPEKKSTLGVAARQFVVDWVRDRRLKFFTWREDNFGRTLADVYDADTGEHLDRACINYMREVWNYNVVYIRD